ncbi:MAG: hypothetical protein IT435_09050 [Phycisphaerales bacterium]|nr:hypothetical protein [Phycisphaerales bacterium]
MTLADLLQHWAITENPFRDEEARSDAVFAKMMGTDPRSVERVTTTASAIISANGHGNGNGSGGGSQAAPGPRPAYHSDFEKLLGNPYHPSTSIVFGEKGSGKTAIRLQITDRIRQHNLDHPSARILPIISDDLNPFLDRIHQVAAGKTPLESFQTIRLVDHIDALLHRAVPRLIDSILSNGIASGGIDLPTESKRTPKQRIRRWEPSLKRDLLQVQAIYDRPGEAEDRAKDLRSVLGVWPDISSLIWIAAAAIGWLPAAVAYFFETQLEAKLGFDIPNPYAAITLAALWLIPLFKVTLLQRILTRAVGARLRRQVRSIRRGDLSFGKVVWKLPRRWRDWGSLPLGDSDAPRYGMLGKLRRVLEALGYVGIIVVVDRVDEPTLVSGDADRMRAVVWPMLNNKFLQQEGIGIKLLLPIELRHLLMKESSAFFQQARMDKQGFVEQLTWSGAMLYDLCESRMRACRTPCAGPISLLDMFAEDVTRQDLVDSLDQMRQPRDAFKFLYRCMTEHAANVTRDQNQWRIPRGVLEMVRRQEADRVQQFYRGIRPA